MAEDLGITPLDGFGCATIMARKSADVAAIGRALGLDPPDDPRVASGDDLALIGTGPRVWLAFRETADGDFAETLRDRLAGLAAVSDQSSSYLVWRLTGEAARVLLQRGVAIDLHPSAFAPGSVAVTQIAHIGVIILQINDLPGYDVAVFRSYGASFRHWLDEQAHLLTDRR